MPPYDDYTGAIEIKIYHGRTKSEKTLSFRTNQNQ